MIKSNWFTLLFILLLVSSTKLAAQKAAHVDTDSTSKHLNWAVSVNISDPFLQLASLNGNNKFSYTIEPIISYVAKSNVLFRWHLGYALQDSDREILLETNPLAAQIVQNIDKGGFAKFSLMAPFRNKRKIFDFRWGAGIGYTRYNTVTDVTIPGTNWGDYKQRTFINNRYLLFCEPQIDLAVQLTKRLGLICNFKVPLILRSSAMFRSDQYQPGIGWKFISSNWILSGGRIFDLYFAYSF